jgi:glycolate oxidase
MGDKKGLLDELYHIVGEDWVVSKEDELIVYECDGYTLEKSRPDAVLFPRTTEQVAEIVRLAKRYRTPFIPRGAGTGLSGGSLAVAGGIVVSLTKMNRILEVDTLNRRIVAEPGVVNLWLTNEVAEAGYYYAPDPSSQQACTIGGNVAENSGGPHTLKYGVTTNHVLGLELVLPDGDLIHTGGKTEDVPGYDLTGFIVGSEGTFGIVTKVAVRIVRKPESYKTMLAVFETVDDATRAISGIIGAGIIPAALEMMDNLIIQAVEAAYHWGFPLDAGAVVIIELDGLKAGMDRMEDRIIGICKANRVREVRVAKTDEERDLLWKSRKRAFGAVGRISPSYVTQDGVIPRTKLPEVLREISRIGERYSLKIANVFHAGDGNLHPIILFDERDSDQRSRVLKAGEEILRACAAVGGSITGEHGIGVEKIDFMPFIFSPEDLAVMADLKRVFNPDDLCNPGKVFPTSKSCVEVGLRRRAAC